VNDQEDREAKFAKACPDSAKILEQDKQNKNGFTDDLRDGAFQKGINWRKTKLEAIHKASKQESLITKLTENLELAE
jgi:hypothetical protein